MNLVRHLIHFAEDGDSSGFFSALAKYHDRDRYRVSFGTLKPMQPELRAFMQDHGVGTFSCEARSRVLYPRAFFSLIRILRGQGCDIFHAHLFDPAVVGLTAARATATPGRVLTRHYSNYHTRIRRPLHTALDRWCTRCAHHVIAVSNETREHLIKAEGAEPARVTTIHNGIDFERVKASTAGARRLVRKELGLGEVFTFLIGARLHPEKGYSVLFEAAEILRGLVGDTFRLVVAGKGPFLDAYKASVEERGLRDVVRFVGFRRDLPDVMLASDVFVLPSVAEAFGLVLAEALYLGLPVVASRTGGIPEVVDDGVDGILVAPGNAVELADTMQGFVLGRIRLPGQGAAAARKVRARFDFRSMLSKYEALYETVLKAT